MTQTDGIKAVIPHETTLTRFDNGRSRKHPKVEKWAEKVTILAFMTNALTGEPQVIVHDRIGRMKAVPLDEVMVVIERETI